MQPGTVTATREVLQINYQPLSPLKEHLPISVVQSGIVKQIAGEIMFHQLHPLHLSQMFGAESINYQANIPPILPLSSIFEIPSFLILSKSLMNWVIISARSVVVLTFLHTSLLLRPPENVPPLPSPHPLMSPIMPHFLPLNSLLPYNRAVTLMKALTVFTTVCSGNSHLPPYPSY